MARTNRCVPTELQSPQICLFHETISSHILCHKIAPYGNSGCMGVKFPVAFAIVADVELTKETFERLQEELKDLKTRGRIDIARAIESARALGDLSENGDYHAAKDAQGKMEARIRQLEAMLKTAKIVETTALAYEVVASGVVVSLRYSGEDEIERFLVGSIEERRSDVSVVSPGSPLGLALLGKSVGDVVSYEAPNGMLSVEIVKIGE